MKITIPIPEKISLNKIYSGIHFRARMQHKEQYQYAVMSARPKAYTGTFPVHIHYHFKTTGNQLDIDNYGYMAKLCADALVQLEVLPDDDQKYIAAVTTTAQKVKKGGDNEVVVTIKPADILGE